MTQALLNNPEMMRELLFATNPGIRDAMERNPALAHALNDPDTMRQAAEMMRNPAAMQHMGRSMDLQMQQISNLPGGEMAIQRAMADMFDPIDAGQRRAEEEAERAREEGRVVPDAPPAGTPVPNPWAAGRGGGAGAGPGPGVGGMGVGGNPMMQQMMQRMMSDPAMMQRMMQFQGQMMGGGAGFNAADYSPLAQQQQHMQQQAMAAAGAGPPGSGVGRGVGAPANAAPAAPGAQPAAVAGG
eukprot:gene7366-27435_t